MCEALIVDHEPFSESYIVSVQYIWEHETCGIKISKEPIGNSFLHLSREKAEGLCNIYMCTYITHIVLEHLHGL